MDVVYVFVYVLDVIFKKQCLVSNVCECMCNILGKEFLEYVRNVFFIGVSGNYVCFNVDGDVEGCFDVLMFIKQGNNYKIVYIGEWDK